MVLNGGPSNMLMDSSQFFVLVHTYVRVKPRKRNVDFHVAGIFVDNTGTNDIAADSVISSSMGTIYKPKKEY